MTIISVNSFSITLIQKYSKLLRKGSLYLPLFTLGMTSISVQVIILRKFLDVFYGNELIIGILLANWMILTGAGAWAGRFLQSGEKGRFYRGISFLLLALLPLLTVPAIVAGRVLFFPTGSMIGLMNIFLFSFLIQAPLCLVSGWLFPSLTNRLVPADDFTLSRSYLAESLGSFSGAMIFNVLLLFLLPGWAILYLLFLVNLYQAWAQLKSPANRKSIFYFAGLFILVPLLLVLISPSEKLNSLLYKGQQVLAEKESPYGNIVITRLAGQLNFYENGLPFSASNDIINREEAVHYAMLQHKDPKKVLLISGGLSGQVQEILKYPVDRIDYLEVNPWIIRMGRQFKLLPSDPRLRVIIQDARLFLKKSREQYDIVLIQLPDPVTAQLNRYFTYEFFREIQKNLTPQAVISLSLRSTADFMNPLSANINSLIYNSLYYNFKHILIVPGTRNYYLASDAELTLKLASLAEQRNIKTDYINAAYLQDDLLEQRNKSIQQKIDGSAGLNRDFHPRAYFEETRLWLLAFKTPWWIPGIILLILLVVYLIRIRREQISLFVTGFTASSLSFLLMMSFQALYGYVYLMAGVLVALFMLGLAIGSLVYPALWKSGNAPSPAWNQIYLGVFVILLMMFLLKYKSLSSSPGMISAIFLTFSLLCGFFTGMQFSGVATASEVSPGMLATRIYSADLAGSALGMLLTAALFFPMAGMVWVCLGLGLINFIVGFVMFD